MMQDLNHIDITLYIKIKLFDVFM